MNRRLVSFPFLIFALLLCSQLALGQQSSSSTSDKTAEETLREKAFDLLESLADQIGSLQSAENRARMGSNIAGSLWPHDEKRARALFKLVENDIKLGLQVEKTAPNAEHTFQVFLKLREDTAARMAKCDPELALTFVRETVPFVNEYARDRDGEISPPIAEKEHELELRLAKQIGANNPEIAIKLARQSLTSDDFPTDLVLVLRAAGRKDKAQATVLYKEIVEKLRDKDFEDTWYFQFARELLQTYTPPESDESTFRELISVFVAKAFAGGCDKRGSEEPQRFCLEIGMLVPLMEKLSPLQARRLNHLSPTPERQRAEARKRALTELDDVAETGTIDEILELESKYPDISDQVHWRAAGMARMLGDLDRAEKIASSYNGDAAVRREMQEYVANERRAANRTEVEWQQTQKMLGDLPLRDQITILLQLAEGTAPIDKKTAVKILAHLNGLVDMLPPGREQTEQQIKLASIYCLANNDRGFAIMEGLLPKLNDLIAASAKLDGYEAHYLRDGEWTMTAEGSVGNILTILANNARYFARYDFDRAVTLAGQFERSEIRMMAQLRLAQGIFESPGPLQRGGYIGIAQRIIY
jgi:hypothetical protein